MCELLIPLRPKSVDLLVIGTVTYNLLLSVFVDNIPVLVVVPGTKKAYQKPCRKYLVQLQIICTQLLYILTTFLRLYYLLVLYARLFEIIPT